jgi:D-3-phosphoglycerate dehydrogenase
MKILANDGLDQSGIDLLKENGFEVITKNVPQELLSSFIN